MSLILHVASVTMFSLDKETRCVKTRLTRTERRGRCSRKFDNESVRSE